MKYILALTVFALSTACAQLQVTSPAQPSCAESAAPVLGIALQTYLSGDYGVNLTNDLKRALEAKGFQVVPDYSYKLVDLATIGIKGEINHWKNHAGEESSRVGNVHLVVYDLDTKKTLLNIDQQRATFAFNAPRPETVIQGIVSAVAQKYCQQ